MAPPVGFKAAKFQSPWGANDPDKFEDGPFGKPFDPDAVDKVMVHRDSGKNNEKWDKRLQNGVFLDGLATYAPIRQGL
ncbi:hypothetical protein AMAG_14810 [Allomyces macrogynus ATCC 38327]|uniref:Uncharacterized protein n=1 Tax=Allomyces macrogynus (strain ATCC 38327) TaxID=578462 RepID=A0A0L0T5G9_ALLM3|nr:hypothetical protein AMAG_14810 [Allomyces macrogynus ATCC 38327]|eukprot:KNE69972.1 hypothetical protein AMAG_14810 [Allomyces macrogynus ATCC 38327]